MLSAGEQASAGAGGSATWNDETASAVAAQLQRRGVVETPRGGTSTGARRSLPDAEGGGEGSRRTSSLSAGLSSAAVDERVRSILSRSNPSLPTVRDQAADGSMTREQLDARVQQILGRHSTGSGGGGSGA